MWFHPYGDLATLDLALDIYSSGFNTQFWYIVLSVATSVLNHVGRMLSEQMPIKLFYNWNYQTLGDKLYVCSAIDFYTENPGFKCKWCEKGAVLGDFCPMPIPPRWITVWELNQSWCVSSLVMGDYYCGVRKFWLSFIWSLWTKTHFLGLKSFLNYAMMVIMLHQSNHQYFLMKVCWHTKVEVQCCDKRSSFPGVTAHSVVIFT